MGDFKPLMKLGAQTVLEREIRTLRVCGVHEITIITGRRAEDIRAAAAGTGIHFIHNPAYAETKMFDSVCLGLSYYEESGKRQEKRRWMAFSFSRWMCRCLHHLRWNMKNTGSRRAMGMSISRNMRKHRDIRF